MDLIFSAFIIFSLRLADQSLGTMRALLVSKNKPIYAAFIGLVESAIWIVAISQVIKDIDDPVLIVPMQLVLLLEQFLGLILSVLSEWGILS